MFEIANTPRDYAWGSLGALSALAGVSRPNSREAELWLGDHAAHSAVLVSDPSTTLREWIAQHPDRSGGRDLPFLVKLLAVAQPLSIQVHPTRVQAQVAFAAENAQGIPVDSADRNYRDDNHKPEIIIALTDGFSALSGFRPTEQIQAILSALSHALPEAAGDIDAVRAALVAGSASAVTWILGNPAPVSSLSNALTNSTVVLADSVAADALDVARLAAAKYPGDPGIVVSLLLNHVVLAAGESLFVPAGCMHAYLHGLGVEVMASSDNVVRGGLTAKHVDVTELARIMDAEAFAPRVVPRSPAPGIDVFEPPIDDFAVTRVVVDGRDAALNIEGPAIAVVTSGSVDLVAQNAESATPTRAFFIEAGEFLAQIAGNGTVFIAHRPVR